MRPASSRDVEAALVAQPRCRRRPAVAHALSAGARPGRAANHHRQVYYHAINMAFLEWVYRDDRVGAQAAARIALDACAPTTIDRWRRATEGEAGIILGDDEAALTVVPASARIGAVAA